ncbi:MAG: DNA-processing protein DprA [Pseudomonadota bacterium]
MMPTTELQRWLQLTLSYAFNTARLKTLLLHAGSIESLQQLTPSTYLSLGLPAELWDVLARWQQGVVDVAVLRLVDAVLQWSAKPSHAVICLGTSDYPELLATCIDPPPQLFVRGDVSLLQLPQIAIVGSRKPTADGRRHARNFAGALVKRGYQITSGLALGIDAESHRGALEHGGKTIAVLGTGLANIYPPTHDTLADQIAEHGALVSELPPQAGPDPWHFPERNRIISGLSHGVLVVEAAERSGSLITARLAAEQGREVFAIPGSINNPMARGCHRLIRQGAKLIEKADEIFEELPALVAWEQQRTVNAPATKPQTASKPRSRAALPDSASTVLPHIGYDPVTLDALVLHSGQAVTDLLPCLLQLELSGHIEMQEHGYVLSGKG